MVCLFCSTCQVHGAQHIRRDRVVCPSCCERLDPACTVKQVGAAKRSELLCQSLRMSGPKKTVRYRPPRDPDADAFLEAFDPSFDEVMGEDEAEDDDEDVDDEDDEDDEDDDDIVLRSPRRIDAQLMNHVALAHARSMVSIARDFHRLVSVLAHDRRVVDEREPEVPDRDEASDGEAQANEPEDEDADPREALRVLMKQQGFDDAATEDAVASIEDGGAP